MWLCKIIFSPAKLAQVLLPMSDWQPFPICTNRAAWEALPASVKTHLVSRAEQALTNALPPLPATLYLEYARVGNRSRFQKPYFDRREMLCALAIAECVEGKGRFLDAAANALWAICEESSWCIPAHVVAQKGGVGLPSVDEPIVDLFAGETGVSVAWTLYLLGPELKRVSARIPTRARGELENRILNPVIERDFGWMALNVTSAENRPNNWTPWIASSVLMAALLCDTNAARRVAVTHKMMRSLDGFLKFHPADGGCDEGPGYWNRAAGSAFDCLDLLHSASGGRIDRFSEPLIREMRRFICRVHIAGDYYVPIGDCAARLGPGLRVNDVLRRGFPAGPPGRLRFALDIPKRARVRLACAVAPRFHDRPGVEFTVKVMHGTREEVAWTQVVDPLTRPEHRAWVPVDVDLRKLAGPGRELLLETRGYEETGDAERAWWGAPALTVARQAPLAIVYLLDTLRADHTGVYGYEPNTTPELDAFAKDAVVFDAAVVHASWTKPSVAAETQLSAANFLRLSCPKR